ncbi:DinB family protein [Flavihumibacter rivuli]|uniref:DinB family protein n=1 Tax=Flavihumibacter rivuli TaxID=2838156 RepID=UPI001BDDCC31|nr:DinB family protein [Flavihumibacter rivuli]ULQ55934.1 DinB family protein [Flavihumibacter rivuli]
MTILANLLRELEQESVTTRKMLERIPEDKFDWKPHPKSMDLRMLSTHLAELPSWVPMILHTNELDFEVMDHKLPVIKSRAELLAFFEQSLAEGKKALAEGNDGMLEGDWTLRSGAKIHDVSPRPEVMRMTYCQIVHHRAQLGVYLRLLDVPIPGSYGPSADENTF